MKEARILEKSIVQAMVFLKELLKRRSGANSGAKTCGQSRSLLEHALLDRSVRGGAGGKSSSSAAGGGGSYRAAAEGYSGQKDQLELIHVIGNYINYNYNFDIPLLATEVLTYLCAVASDWEPRPPSFVGYFGDSASQIVASFVSLASDSYDGLGESSTDASRATGEINTTLASREALQTAIFNFVGTVIETQPGLGMLFLTGSDSIGGTQSINSSKSTTEGSILSAVVAHLSHHEKVMSSKPSLLPAIVRFLDVLWQKAPEYTRVLDRLRNGDCATKFWDGLKSILSSVANNVSMPPTSLTRSVTIDGGDISSTDATTANTTSQLFARPQGIDVYREQLGFGGFIQSWMDGQFTMADVGKCIPRSLLDDRVKIYCNGMVVKAHVVRILALEIYHGLRQQQQGKPTVDKIGPIATKAVEFIKSVFSDRNNVSKLFLRDCDCAYDPNKMTSALSTASQGVYVVKDSPSFDSDSSYSRVTVDLNAFQVSTWENYFDTGRVYGDGYVYDLELLAVKYGIANELPPLSEYEDDENTMDGGYATSSPAATAGWGFLSQVCAANHNFSITDAEIVMLRSWRFFIEVISSRTGYILWDQSLAALAPGSKKASEDLFNLIITLSNIVSEEKRSGFVMVSYRSEICELLVFLARHWIETHGQRLTDSASTNTTSLTELFQNVVDLMDSLKNCLLDDIFPVVENPHPFHQSLLTVLLLVLRMSRKIISRLTAISPSTATTATMVTTLPSLIKKHQENVIALFPVVSTCLSAHFAKVKQDSATVLDHLGASSSSSSYGGVSLEKSERVGLFSILLSVMNEFINADQKIEPTIWLPIIEKAEIISDLLTCFSLTISIATSQAGSGGMDLDSAAVNDCTSISKNPTKYTHEILYLLISLAAVPVAAERLAVHGILSTFSNNSFSPTIADGNVQAYIRHHERNPWHVTWCLMLSVMSRMLSNLVDSSLFVNGALSFTGLYWGQISRVLSLNSDNNNSEPDLLLGELEEIQRISQIFYHLGLYMSRQSSKSEVGQSNNIQLLFGYQGRSLLLMRYYVYLFMHPHMLSSKVMAISRDEKEMKVDTPSVVGEQGSTPAGAAGAPSSSSSSRRAGNNSNNISSVGGVLEELFQAKMLNICKNIMRFLVLSTNAESILVRICGRKTGQRLNSSIVSSYNHDGGDGSGGDNGGAVLFSPTMVIYSGANQEEVTLGTLVDLMGYVLDFLQKYHGSATNATTATTTTTTGFPSKNGVSNTLRKGSFGFGSGGGGGSSGGVVASAAQTLQSLVTQDALLELTEITYVMMITQVVSFLSLPHVELSQKREAVVELSTELESSASLVQSKLKSIGGGGTVALIDHLFNETAKVEGSVFTQIMAI